MYLNTIILNRRKHRTYDSRITSKVIIELKDKKSKINNFSTSIKGK